MKPGSFDAATARSVVGDSQARGIEAKARQDADAGMFGPPKASEGKTYWGKVREDMALVVYTAAFNKRTARNQRKVGSPS